MTWVGEGTFSRVVIYFVYPLPVLLYNIPILQHKLELNRPARYKGRYCVGYPKENVQSPQFALSPQKHYMTVNLSHSTWGPMYSIGWRGRSIGYKTERGPGGPDP